MAETHPRVGRAVALRPASSCLKLCQISFKEKWRDIACSSKCVSPPSSDDFVSQQEMSPLLEHVGGCRPLSVVMSPTHNRLLDLAVEIATGQLRNGRHFACITRTNSSLSHARSWKALRSIEEHTQRLLMVVRSDAGAS